MVIIYPLPGFSSSTDIFLSAYSLFVRPLPLCVGNAVSHYLLLFISDKFIESFLIIQESN